MIAVDAGGSPVLRVLSEPQWGGRPLLCFPPAGAGPSYFRFLPDALAAQAAAGGRLSAQSQALAQAPAPAPAVIAVQYPGREARSGEAHATQRSALVDEIVDAVLTSVPPEAAQPVLLGHSLGAQLAYECALRLEDAGRPAYALVLSARASSATPHGTPDPASASDETLLEWLMSLGGTPGIVLEHPELAALVAATLRADLLLSAQRPPADGAKLSSPLLVLCGEADPAVPVGSVTGWAAHSSGEVSTVLLDGDHDAIRTDLRWLAALQSMLDTAAARSSTGGAA